MASVLKGKYQLCSVFHAAVCKMQARKCYVKSLPSVMVDKRSCFSEGERSAVKLSLITRLPSGSVVLVN